MIKVPPADKYYLSFGGGVNSTALLLWLMDEGIYDDKWEIVFCDPGSERPETYEHVEWIDKHVMPVTVLNTLREGLPLYEYCVAQKIMPVRTPRWCTVEYKVRPLASYCADGLQVVGIDAGEEHRATQSVWEGKAKWYPLVDAGIDREQCIDIIEDHGVPVPPKSGCYFCPFQRDAQWRELYDCYPDLFQKALRMEQAARVRRALSDKVPLTLGRRPLSSWSPRKDLVVDKAVCFQTTKRSPYHVCPSHKDLPQGCCHRSDLNVYNVLPYAETPKGQLCKDCLHRIEIDYRWV